jgi:four helix bundle protein
MVRGAWFFFCYCRVMMIYGNLVTILLMKPYKDIVAWQVGYELAKETFFLTQAFPHNERFSYTSQLRRSSLSIPSNIAEGFRRQTRSEFRHFCHIAFGSAAEFETQLELARDVGLAPANHFTRPLQLTDRVSRLLNGLCGSLK